MFQSVSVVKVWRLVRLAALLALFALPADCEVSPGPSPADIQAFLANASSMAMLGPRSDLATVQRFYSLRNYRPAWTSSVEDAATAILALASAANDGLNLTDYRIEDIEARAQSLQSGAAVEYEVLLSENLLRYERDLRQGRVAPELIFRDVDIAKAPFDPAAETNLALASRSFAAYLSQLAPPHREYQRLKLALARYRAMEARGGWDVTSAETGPIAGPEINRLRDRLAMEDIAVADSKSDSDESGLLAALQRYQVRNGLVADGKLSKSTLESLNVPVSDRISAIVANMERWRWVPRAWGTTYIEVNAADASLKMVQDGDAILTSKIVAGKPSTPTPIFSATVEAITVNPFWIVPGPIARREIAPKVRKHPGYLESHHMFVDALGRIEQRPGPDNSLGQLKLEMPNRFDSYLHDTPERALFARDKRFFSHGCMRVEQIEPLASIVLTGDPSTGLAQIEDAIAAGVNKRISLDKTLPVFVLYWTAMADDDGVAGFRPDVYGRDEKLLAALAGKQVAASAAENAYSDCSSTAG